MSDPNREIQREDAIDRDDLRETDSYDEALPVKKEVDLLNNND